MSRAVLRNLSTRTLSAAAAAFVASVALLAYLPSLKGYFLSDDFGFVRIFHDRPLADFPRLFVDDWSGGLWGHPLDEIRPIIGLSYRLDSFLWGLDPTGYHFTNMAFHAVAAVLVFLIAREAAGGSGLLGLLAGLLFAVAPAHVEAVSWIAARVDVISVTFYLASFYLFLLFRRRGSPWWGGLSFVAYALALFSKEISVTLPFLLVAYDLLCHRPLTARTLLSHLPFFALLGGYMFVRHLAFDSAVREDMLGAEAVRSFLQRQGYYLWELLPPLRPLPDALAWALVAAALTGALAVARARGGRELGRLVFFGPVWHLLVLLPTLVAYSPNSHRYLLLPSAGLAVFSVIAVSYLPRRAALAAGAALVLLLVPLSLGLADYQGDWTAAARLSREFTQRAEMTAHQAPPGSTVVLDVPGSYGRAYLWAWALPFALEEPFSDAGLYDRYTVLERPETYRCPFCWGRDRLAAIDAALASHGDIYLVYLDEGGRAAMRVVPSDRWREMTALARLGGPEARAFALASLLDDLQPPQPR
ncbi:MAG TPA: glycosyltransferase family 39 protein [Dehalococcoidia bacterium]|nr:glycosyltransferase family 39 protein [Dehalococcoidia bacterium]